MNKMTVRDIKDWKGKRALVRCDFNVPMKDGVITDENRIMGALPTIKYLMEQGAKSHPLLAYGQTPLHLLRRSQAQQEGQGKSGKGRDDRRSHHRKGEKGRAQKAHPCACGKASQRTARQQGDVRARRDRSRCTGESRRLQGRRMRPA